MKKNIFSSATLILKQTFMLALLFTLSYCGKKADPTPAVNTKVDPFMGYLIAAGFDETTTPVINNNMDNEIGSSFKPIVNGKITAIVAQIPADRSDLRVTVWNKTTGVILGTFVLNVVADTKKTETITAINLVAGTEYFISMNTNDLYRHKRTDLAAVTYPIVSGDIAYTGYAYIGGTLQAMPTIYAYDRCSGDVSFVFQKD